MTSNGWKKGQSGNPNGRPVGNNGCVQKLRLQIQQSIPEIIEMLKKRALQGDVAAAKLLLERVIPVVKEADVSKQGKEVITIEGDVQVENYDIERSDHND